MKIQKLTLEGFRGFKDKTEFELHPNVNVFVGVNGSGKTSVLDAVGMLLGEYINFVFEEDKKADFSTGDVSIGLSKNCIYLNLIDVEGLTELLEIAVKGTVAEKKSNGTTSNSIRIDTIKEIQVPKKSIKPTELPVCMISKYLMNPKISESYNSEFSPNELYNFDDKKFITYSNFNDLVEWFINEENNENRVKLRTDTNYKSPRLAPIRYALEKLFVALSSAKYSKLHVDTVDGFKPTLFIKKDDLFFKLIDLSEGEKILILLVSDIARKLTMINNEQKADAEEILNQGAIVLIDEIDLHLHPAWQRDIIPALTHVFPNVQFLVTTHSPQVLSNVKKESVHMIENFKRVPFTPSIYGADSNMILWDIFGVKKRPNHADEKFREYYRALETKDRDTALKLLEGLQKHFGEDRLDVQKAKTAFEFEYDEYLPEV